MVFDSWFKRIFWYAKITIYDSTYESTKGTPSWILFQFLLKKNKELREYTAKFELLKSTTPKIEFLTVFWPDDQTINSYIKCQRNSESSECRVFLWPSLEVVRFLVFSLFLTIFYVWEFVNKIEYLGGGWLDPLQSSWREKN